jgi:hypothetical protein
MRACGALFDIQIYPYKYLATRVLIRIFHPDLKHSTTLVQVYYQNAILLKDFLHYRGFEKGEDRDENSF